MGRLTGERRALSAAVLAFYGFLYLLVSIQPPPGWAACFGGLALVYGLGFFGLVAGYFWARWYAIGLGMSGLITGVISVFQAGPEPVLLFYAATHGFVSLTLWGNGMSRAFDGRTEWRERFHMDENATHRLGKAVIKLGLSLPYVVMYALAPREDMGGAALALGGALLAASGVWALFRLRTWGVFALAGAAAVTALSLVAAMPGITAMTSRYAVNVPLIGVGAVVFLTLAVVPFARPLLQAARRANS